LPALHLLFFPSLSSALLLILFLLGLFGQSAKKERGEKPREGPATKGATKRELTGAWQGGVVPPDFAPLLRPFYLSFCQ